MTISSTYRTFNLRARAAFLYRVLGRSDIIDLQGKITKTWQVDFKVFSSFHGSKPGRSGLSYGIISGRHRAADLSSNLLRGLLSGLLRRLLGTHHLRKHLAARVVS